MRAHPVLAAGVGERRRRLLASARGQVLDVGGFPDNSPHYTGSASVHDVGLDELAALPVGGFDSVVCTLVLCRVADLADTLATLRRLVSPGGQLLFLEHVRGAPVRAIAQRLSASPWSRLFDGCHPDRDTVAAVRQAGFLITDLDRFAFRTAAPLIAPGVQGIARPK